MIKHIDIKWVVIWSLIYFSFIFIDLALPKYMLLSSILKYTGLFLCVIYTYATCKKDTRLVLAMFLTFLADTILMLVGARLIGVYVFCFAQMFHTLRLSRAPSAALMGYFVMLFIVFASGILWGIPALYVVSFSYAATLLTNLRLSWRWYRSDRMNPCAINCLAGFLLFICCDINVALSYLSLTGGIPAFIAPISSFLVFVFYYPSQILISNSSNLASPMKISK